jgi:lipoate-protein ligase A
MRRLDLTLPTGAENVALDEALLEWAESEDPAWEFLRLWESPQPAVVVGRSSRVPQEVNVDACRAQQVSIIRRPSGGAAIVAGPGCLMYAVVLSYQLRPELKDIGRAHEESLEKMRDSLQHELQDSVQIERAGTSDLVFSNEDNSAAMKKFSGNSMRAKRTHLLYHGTLLYDFDLRMIETYLQVPPRQPEYREGRSHREFVANVPLSRTSLLHAIDRAWPTEGSLIDWPEARCQALVAERIGRESWNLRFP